MADWSDDYRDQLIQETRALIGRFPDAVSECRETASDIIANAMNPLPDQSPELTWPWDPKSPSVLTILTESLGESLAVSAVQPFSDLLALFPARGNEVIGDSIMASMCQLPLQSIPSDPDNVSAPLPDAVLPPFSAAFCDALCRLPEGKTQIRPDLLSFPVPSIRTAVLHPCIISSVSSLVEQLITFFIFKLGKRRQFIQAQQLE